MWKTKQSALLTLVVTAGLVSAMMCQSHMVTEAAAVPSHHATEEAATSHHRHQGTHGEEHDTVDPCCVLQVADTKALNSIVPMPDAADVVMAEAAITRPPAHPVIPQPEWIHAPPRNRSLLEQTCILLI